MCEHQPQQCRDPTAEAGLAPSMEQVLGQGGDGGAHGEKTPSGVRLWDDRQGRTSMEHTQERGRSGGL